MIAADALVLCVFSGTSEETRQTNAARRERDEGSDVEGKEV